MTIDNENVIKSISLTCPIIDEDGSQSALVIDPLTNDSSYVDLKLTVSQKLFGGGSIKAHGKIDKDGKKSWEKKGR